MRVVQIAVALLVLAALLVSTHWYLWRRLVRDTVRSRRFRRVAVVMLGLLGLTVPAAAVSGSGLPGLALVGYVWLALWFYLLLALAATEFVKPVARAWPRRHASHRAPTPATDHGSAGGTATTGASAPVAASPTADDSATPDDSATSDNSTAAGSPAHAGEPVAATAHPAARPDHDPSRRLFVARAAAITAGLAAAGTVGYGMVEALGTPRIRRVRVELAKLPRAHDGYRIALISDLHLGPLNGRGRTEGIVRIVNGLAADAVAICGDLVDGTVAQLGRAAQPLADLRSRDGSYFVTGNHDYYSGYQPWLAEVAALGIRPLHNERTDLGGLILAGVNDNTGGGYGDPPDYGRALDGRDTSVPVVLLAHQPVQVHEAAKHGVDLQLSGHTHGGQMVPFNLVVRAVQPVVSGYAVVDGTQLFVTNGVGFWGPPVRVGAPAEVTLVELRSPG